MFFSSPCFSTLSVGIFGMYNKFYSYTSLDFLLFQEKLARLGKLRFVRLKSGAQFRYSARTVPTYCAPRAGAGGQHIQCVCNRMQMYDRTTLDLVRSPLPQWLALWLSAAESVANQYSCQFFRSRPSRLTCHKYNIISDKTTHFGGGMFIIVSPKSSYSGHFLDDIQTHFPIHLLRPSNFSGVSRWYFGNVLLKWQPSIEKDYQTGG